MTREESIKLRHQIRRGQKNLDQMKEEIYEEARILTSLARKYIVENNFCDAKYESDIFKCVWSLEQSGFDLNLRCNCMNGKCAYQVDITSKQKIPLEITEMLHDDFHTFVDGIHKTFPQLSQALKWHINASKRNI